MKRKTALCLLLTVLALFSIAGCSEKKNSQNQLEDFAGSTLGVVTGSLYDGYSRELFPDAVILYYKNFSEVLQSLKQGKIDGCMLDQPSYHALKRDEPSLSCFDVPAYDVELGFGFQKNADGEILQSQMNEFLAELKENGAMDALIDKWYGESEPNETLIAPDLSDNHNKLNVAMDTVRKPFLYLRNGQYTGLEGEVFYMFCERYDYAPVYDNVPFTSGIAGLNVKKYDMVVGGIYMTSERKQSVNFSEPYMYADVVMVKTDGTESAGFFAALASGFRKTFIEEARWKLIVSGIASTLLITLCSAVFGTLLGFGLYMLCRTFGKIAKRLIKLFTVLTNGIPAVVILMLLYYIIFGKSDISGTVVSIIGFSLIIAAFVCEKLSVSVDSVPSGQTEAALAMGFSENRAFFNVILPQALKFFMPLYRAEMAALVKSTAVVGYIAVQDLTQISDIIRSNTYEAFFPIVSSAVIYLILSFAITRLIEAFIIKLEPRNRGAAKILNGVKANDRDKTFTERI